MTIAKRLQFAALIVGMAISVVSARAADDAKEPETYWIVKRTGSTVQLLPANEDTLQPLLKKQAQADAAKRPEGAKAADKSAVAQGTSAPTASGSGKSEPKRLPPAATTRTTISPQPKADANVPLPISLTGERLVSGTEPTTYDYDETFPDRVTISRPAPTNPNSAMMAIESPAPQVPDGTSANYNDYHTGVRMEGGNRSYQRSAPPEPIAPGGQAHLSDDCPDCRDFQNYNRDRHDGYDIHKDCFNPCGDCGFFAGADYLYVRPTFSENTAYFRRNTTIDANENVTVTDTVVHQDFDYTSSPRIFLGYRFCDCGGEIRFTYWNYDNSSSQITGPATTDTIYAGQLEINTSVPGQQLLVDSHLNMNVYDIDYSKCVCYGGGKPCDPCHGCPVWTLKYTAGVRIADVRRTDDNILLPVDDLSVAGHISADFIGAGPRLGIEGRRYCRDGALSFFARGSMSLLLGEYDLKETRFDPTLVPGTTDNYFDSHARVIPVAEIELGGTYQVSQRISASVGYLFQAWWDLGAFEQIPGNVFLNPIDDSNIMSFDGLFARVEVCF